MFSKSNYKPNLFNQDSDSDDGQPSGFGVNKDFAKNFNKLRSKELAKKYKNDGSDTDSDSDDSDSSDNETINPKFDEAFFKAMASLKKKDPKIYDGDVKFFDEFDEGGSTSASVKDKKALTIVDYERKILLEKGGIYDDEDEDEDQIDARPQSPSYNQEQDTLRNEFKKVIEDDDSDDGEWGGIFKRRDKTKEEEAAEEAQYTKWLAGEKANIGENAEVLKPLKEYWTDPKLAKDEAFLRDYILSNGYSKDPSKVPCYDDIIGEDEPEMSEDEQELEKQAEFEHKYNFRFEEPDSEFIKRYPRTIENSVRRTDDRRKLKRQEVKDRKLKEKEQKMKELEMLSNLKKREIEEKIAKLKLITGNEELALNDCDLDGDFDPEEHDRKMQAIFDSEYYQVDEGETKPECPEGFEDLQVEDWDNYDPTENKEEDENEHCEDDDFNMDADFNPEDEKKAFQNELIENTRDRKRRRKRKSKFAEMLQKNKPVFDPNDHKSFGEYLDEYYKLDYEDVIGDTPCRFKYTETVPNDFGLSVEEILLAKNKELNQWASLKKTTQIRPEHVERNEIGLYKQRGRNEALKRKILQSLFEEPSEDEEVPSNKTEVKTNNKKKIEPLSLNTVDNFKVLDDFTDKKDTTNAESIPTESEKPSLSDKPGKKKRKISASESNNALPVQEQPPSKKSKTNESDKKEEVSPKIILNAKFESTDDQTKKNNLTPIVKKDLTSKKAKSNHVAPHNKLNSTKPQSKTEKSKPTTKNQLKSNHPKGFDPVRFAAAKAAAAKNKQKLSPRGEQKTSVNLTKHNTEISDERLRAFGINPKKFQKKQKYGTTTAKGGQPENSQNNNGTVKHNKKPTSNQSKSTPKNQSKPGARSNPAFQQMKQRLFSKQK